MGENAPDARPGTAENENVSVAEIADAAEAGEAGCDSSARDGRLQQCFEGASRLGPLLLICVFALYVWPAFLGRTPCFPSDPESGRILRHVMEQGAWPAPSAGGVAQWPGFSALFTIILKCAGYFGEITAFPALLAGLSAFCALLTLLGVWCLGLAARLGPRAALSAGLILLCAPVSALLANFTGPEILAVALTLFSLCCFCRGWQREASGLAVPSGCLLAALAALTGGPYYLLLPFLGSLVFLCWLGRVQRAQKFDAVFGFALCLALIAAWLGAVMLWGNADEYFRRLRADLLPLGNTGADFRRRALPDAGAALLGLLPWLALVVFVSWTRVAREAATTLKVARAERAGAAFVWIALACAALLAPLASGPAGPGITLCALAALLLGKALLRLSNFGSRFFYSFVVLCLLVSAAGMTALSFSHSGDWLARTFNMALPPELSGDMALPGIGLCCLAAAFILVRFTNLAKPAGSLLACTLLAAALAQPVMLWLEPRFCLNYGSMLWRRDGPEKKALSREQGAPAPAEAGAGREAAPKPEQPERADAPAKPVAAPDAPEESRQSRP
ncbi:MAG: hypothetical protein LBN96_04890 [Desulfovibrio sp.]|jgi:hypothetical protein|nr:hypothetical protein [Desulfovibrio sp.]